MITNFTQSLSISAASSITTPSGETKVVAYMSASIAIPGGISFNNSIQEPELYFENKDIVDGDFTEFKDQSLTISMQYKEAE